MDNVQKRINSFALLGHQRFSDFFDLPVNDSLPVFRHPVWTNKIVDDLYESIAAADYFPSFTVY